MNGMAGMQSWEAMLLLTNLIPSGVFLKIPCGPFLWANHVSCEIMRTTPGELLGAEPEKILHPASVELFRKEEALVVARRRPHTVDQFVTMPSGHFHFLTTIVPIRDGDRVVAILGIVQVMERRDEPWPLERDVPMESGELNPLERLLQSAEPLFVEAALALDKLRWGGVLAEHQQEIEQAFQRPRKTPLQ